MAKKRAARWLLPLSLATLALLTFMLWAYVPPDIAASRVDVHGDRVRYALLVGHIAFGSVATLAGLLQVWPALRNRLPRVHRWIGRTYFHLGVFPAVALAVPVTLTSESGLSNMLALLVMNALWAWTGIAGLRAARRRRFGDHRRWMIRNYAITLAILASRLWAGPLIVLGLTLLDTRVYEGNQVAMIHDIASAGTWLALFANLAVVEWHIRRPERIATKAKRARAAEVRTGAPARVPVTPPAG